MGLWEQRERERESGGLVPSFAWGAVSGSLQYRVVTPSLASFQLLRRPANVLIKQGSKRAQSTGPKSST